MKEDERKSLQFSMLLGGTPTPTPDRFGTSLLVEGSATTILVDVGPGATRRLVQAGSSPTEIDAVVFTHHHFDHNAGFPGLFLSRWDQSAGRFPELSIYGPDYTSQFVDRLFSPEIGAYWPDLHARMGFPGSQQVYMNRGGELPRLPPDPAVFEVAPPDTFEIGELSVSTALARHVQPFLESNAYRIESGGISIVYTGDTEPCEEVSALADGCDVLISMCWDFQERMEDQGEHHGQTGTLGAAEMARDSGAKALVLTHAGPTLREGLGDQELERIRSIYSGPVHLSNELDSFEARPGSLTTLKTPSAAI